MKKIKDCSFCFFKKFISFCKKIIRTPLIFIVVFFISQASGWTLVSAYTYFNPASYQIFHAGASSGEQISSFTQASYTNTTISNTTNYWSWIISDDFTFYDELYYPPEPDQYYYTPYGYATVCASDNLDVYHINLNYCDMYNNTQGAGGVVDITGLANGDYVFIENWPGNNHILWFRILSGEIVEIFNPVYFSVPETCTDGIMNQDETEIDTGGVCTPPSEPTCSDGILNQDETSIDTGGVCGSYLSIILDKEITSFNLKNLTPNVDGIIDEVNHTIILNVPFGTDVTTIVPTITISSGASINPNDNTAQNFSSPVIYTVTATDISTQAYIVTVVIAKPIHDPVILIPGITGTYLLRDYGDKTEIWPNPTKVILSIRDLFLKDLSLEIDGKENLERPIVIGDIIRGIPSLGIHVFDRLISELIDNGGYVEGEDLFVFPYDWRISTSQNAVLLKEKINKILLDTGYESVNIIAHSMGGLIAKKYIANEGISKVDQLIFLGTPQLGAPKAFKVLMFGDSMGYEKFSIPLLRPSIAKFISQNMPSVYELLPSEKYIENNGSYVTDALNEIIDLSSFNLNYLETQNLMVEKGRNPLMFPFAKNLHDSIDDLDLSGIETHNFVGCGTKTIGGITVKQKLSWISLGFRLVDDFELKYVNGDETVPLESASKTIGANIYFAQSNTHGSLPSAEGVRQSVLSILKGEELQNYPNILTDASTCNISGKVVSVHSPVELHIYDEEGNHTGPNSNGDIEYNVTGVQYDVIDGEKFAFLPDGVNYEIVTQATDTGGYNFQIEDQNKNDEITATYDWTLIPLETLQAKGEISVGPDYPASEYKVTMDNNGDNIPDTTISSNLPTDFKFYLNVLRKAVNLLDLEEKIERDILNKIDKVEKEYDKNKKGKESEKLIKLLQKINNSNGKLKDISPEGKSVIVNSINTLLDILK